MVAGTELPIDRGATAVEMAEEMFGDGVTVVSASYTGDNDSSGIYTNGNAISGMVTPGNTGVMFSTGDLRGFTPIRIAANTFGEHDMLMLSPLHRVLIRGSLAELLFGENEVLVTARDLVNDRSVRPVEGGTVTYVHILFNRHQVAHSEGLATERFFPGPQTTKSFEEDTLREICTLFPEVDPETGSDDSPTARRTLKRYEAQLLLSTGLEAA